MHLRTASLCGIQALLVAGGAAAQGGATTALAFDVVSIRQNTSATGAPTSRVEGGRYVASNASLQQLGLPNATWLTFRRTYSTWAHANGVPGRVLADLTGHAKVDMSVSVYAQVIDGAKRNAAEKVSGGLFTIVHAGQGAQEPTL